MKAFTEGFTEGIPNRIPNYPSPFTLHLPPTSGRSLRSLLAAALRFAPLAIEPAAAAHAEPTNRLESEDQPQTARAEKGVTR